MWMTKWNERKYLKNSIWVFLVCPCCKWLACRCRLRMVDGCDRPTTQGYKMTRIKSSSYFKCGYQSLIASTFKIVLIEYRAIQTSVTFKFIYVSLNLDLKGTVPRSLGARISRLTQGPLMSSCKHFMKFNS